MLLRLSLDEPVNRRQHVLDHLRRQAGIDADEEGVGGDHVGVGQRADDAMLDVRVGRMPQQVAAEQIAGLDAGGFERVDQFGAREGRARAAR